MSTEPGVTPPLIIFHRFVPTARIPQRADKSGIGTLPTRAFRYCDAITAAAAFGYYVFPPISFTLMWDGTEVIWTWDGAEDWYPLTVAQFPGFRDYFDSLAPTEIQEFAPPFLTAMKEPGIVQIWSGLVARTAPGWSVLIRPLANLPRSQNFDFYEGIVETDRWFGPLFINIRLAKTDVPIAFSAEYPLFQVQPVQRASYEDATLNDYVVNPDLAALSPEDWDSYYETVVRPNVNSHRPRGEYAAAARKRRASQEGS